MTFFRTLPSRPLLRLAANASAQSRRPTRLLSLPISSSSSTPFSALLQCRTYAKRVTSTAELIPGSQQPITDPAAQKEYANAEGKMKASFEWFRKDCAEAETRSTGRVTPAILSPVRVRLPNSKDSYRLEDLAIVGVKEGTTLVVTVFEDDGTLKHVEQAIYDAKLPNIIPQRVDGRTLKIPIPKPTVESRTALYTAAQRKAEDSRIAIRKQHQASLKKGKYAKRSVEYEEFQKLTDRYIGEVDKALAQLKKSSSPR